MFSKTTSTLLALTTMMAIASVVTAAPSGLRPRMHRRDDSSSGGSSGSGSSGSSSGSGDYQSLYYEWVPVEYDKCKNWNSYKDYHLVKADSYDKDKVEIFVCLVKFSEDNSYRIGWFDPSVAFLCTVVYQGDVIEAKDDKYDSYYLTTLGDYQAYWASWDELLNYTEDHIVYAPDHDCVPGEVCWKVNSGGGFITYTDPDGTKTDTWGSQSGSDSGSKSRRSASSWTKALGKRDYEKPSKPQEYAPPEEYCYIGYGSSVTDYKVFYGYEDKAYQSDDIRYNKDVKALVILIDEGSSSSSTSTSSGNYSGGDSGSGSSGSGDSGSGGGSSGGSSQ